MAEEKKHFDADKLIHRMYHRIVLWHNNDERLNNEEMGRELKFLCTDLTEDVLRAVFGETEVKVDNSDMTLEQKAEFDKEKEQRLAAMEERLKNASRAEKEAEQAQNEES